MTKAIPHGTQNGYGNYGCRCGKCRVAAAAYYKKYAAAPCAAGCGEIVYGRYRPGTMCRSCRAAARTISLEGCHGTETGYSKGCRCRPCRAAAAKGRQRRRRANPEATRAYDRARYYGRKVAV